MIFQQALPAPPLRRHIRCYYSLTSASDERCAEGLLVPDGHLELGFNLGAPRHDLVGGGWQTRPDAAIDDVLTVARLVRWDGPIRFVAVKFHYEAALDLLGMHADDVRQHPVEFSLLPMAGAESLRERIATAAGWEAMRYVLDAFFLSRLPTDRIDPLVRHVGDALRRTNGSTPIHRLAAASGVCRRTLSLRVHARTGLSPKRLAQILRTRAVIREFRRMPRGGSSGLAFSLGFCDQSHLIREFRSVVGCAPSAFFAGRPFVSDMIGLTGASRAAV